MKILFICSSNICRSPYCEYVFKRMISLDAELALKVDSVKSAAVFNKSCSIHPKAKLALEREGFDSEYIQSHKPKFKWGDSDVFDEADIIIGMTKSNELFLPLKYHKKFIPLSTAVDGKYTKIPDPFLMKDIKDYYAVMDQIKEYLVKLADCIKKEDNFVDKLFN